MNPNTPQLYIVLLLSGRKQPHPDSFPLYYLSSYISNVYSHNQFDFFLNVFSTTVFRGGQPEGGAHGWHQSQPSCLSEKLTGCSFWTFLFCCPGALSWGPGIVQRVAFTPWNVYLFCGQLYKNAFGKWIALQACLYFPSFPKWRVQEKPTGQNIPLPR